MGPALIWKRGLAFLADILIVNLVIFFPFKSLLERSIPEFSTYSEAYNFLINNQSYVKTLTIISFVMSLFAILYFAMIEYRIQQTPGKILFNISVVSQTKRLLFWQCLVRGVFLIPFFPFFLLWIIDPLFMFFTKRNQRLSEIVSRTKTVQKYSIG